MPLTAATQTHVKPSQSQSHPPDRGGGTDLHLHLRRTLGPEIGDYIAPRSVQRTTKGFQAMSIQRGLLDKRDEGKCSVRKNS